MLCNRCRQYKLLCYVKNCKILAQPSSYLMQLEEINYRFPFEQFSSKRKANGSSFHYMYMLKLLPVLPVELFQVVSIA